MYLPTSELKRAILFQISQIVNNNRLLFTEDLKRYLGCHFELRQLYSYGHMFIAVIALDTELRDKDIPRTIHIVCDFSMKVHKILHAACHFWNLPIDKFMLVN